MVGGHPVGRWRVTRGGSSLRSRMTEGAKGAGSILRAAGPALARDERGFFASLKNDRGDEGGMARSRGWLVRCWRVTRGRFFAALKNDRGGEGGWLDLAGIRSGVGA